MSGGPIGNNICPFSSKMLHCVHRPITSFFLFTILYLAGNLQSIYQSFITGIHMHLQMRLMRLARVNHIYTSLFPAVKPKQWVHRAEKLHSQAMFSGFITIQKTLHIAHCQFDL